MRQLLRVTFAFVLCVTQLRASVRVLTDPDASPRELYGVSKLQEVVSATGFQSVNNATLIAAVRSSKLFDAFPSVPQFAVSESEAFRLSRAGNTWIVAGSDPSGVLYGCLELARLSRAENQLPRRISVKDKPAFRIRGTNLFWMKGGTYNWAVTPENFAWFFDRALMVRYLDELAANRLNTLFFWNGHPFPYFLALPRFPEARALSDTELARNISYFQWFTREADRRGIWTVFHFYNIHVSPNFAKSHRSEGVNEENPESTPLLASYMRYCVSEFVKTYPSVGLMVTAGEALHVKAEEYVRDVIVAGIKDTGKSPPLIVREWTIDPYRFRDIILPSYGNLFTMMKHNTEMLVSPFPDERNKLWVSFAKNHIVNLHELADIKPFRWGSPVWIQEAVRNWHKMGFSGFHVYPMTSWMWPTSLDRTEPQLSVLDRDWIWLEAFGRYGWDPDRPASEEAAYWKNRLSRRFGNEPAGEAAYNYYVQTGPVLPGFQNLINIYNMNHFPTSVSEESTLNAILHAPRWGDGGDFLPRPLDEVTLEKYESRNGKLPPEARTHPPLSVNESLERSSTTGIDPLSLADTFITLAEESLHDLESTSQAATSERDEFARLVSDNRCILYLARYYRAKIVAAQAKEKYDASASFTDYDRMLESLDQSLAEYEKLADVASENYRQASDFGAWHSWTLALKQFQEEAAFYHGQRALTSNGAEVAYLGLDGPMGNASHAFHWLLEDGRKELGWNAQSYAFGDGPFHQANLVVVYDLSSPWYQRQAAALQTWVQQGGKVLLWDVSPVASPFLEGIRFQHDSSYMPPGYVAFDQTPNPLNGQLAGKKFDLDPGCMEPSDIVEFSAAWHELAYTVRESQNIEQIQWGYETFGPRWTSLLNSSRRPLFLVRNFGSGEVAVATLGSCNVLPQAGVKPGQPEQAPLFLPTLVRNILLWAQAR